MRRTILISIAFLFGSLAGAQSLSDLEQNALKAQSEWFRLASDLDLRLARMLPCAPAVGTSIEDTHKASTARMEALSAYAAQFLAVASRDLEKARELQKTLTDPQANTTAERADTEQERAGIQSQLTNLAESVRRRVALTVANDELRAIEDLVQERARLVAEGGVTESTRILLSNLVVALENREEVIRRQVPALEEERNKWNGFYAARMARARVECSVIGAGQ